MLCNSLNLRHCTCLVSSKLFVCWCWKSIGHPDLGPGKGEGRNTPSISEFGSWVGSRCEALLSGSTRRAADFVVGGPRNQCFLCFCYLDSTNRSKHHRPVFCSNTKLSNKRTLERHLKFCNQFVFDLKTGRLCILFVKHIFCKKQKCFAPPPPNA